MDKRELHPDFPVVSGKYQMTREWSCTLPEAFNRRIEDGALVIWRPGITFWVIVWGNDNNETREQRLSAIREEASPARTDEKTDESDGVTRLTYRLSVDGQDAGVNSFYAFALSDDGHVQLAAYVDRDEDISIAEAVAASLAYTA